MKKYIKSYLLFIIIAVFVITGMFSADFVRLIAGSPVKILRGESTVSEQIQTVNGQLGGHLTYRNNLIDLYSLVLRLNDTKIVEKSDTVVALSDTDMLCTEVDEIEEDYIDSISQDILRLQETALDNDAEFLYVYAPDKEYWSILPEEVNNYSVQNHDALMRSCNQLGIQTFDLAQEMTKETATPEEWYYVTDHHWKAETGFWAHGQLCERLNEQYGFSYDKSLTDINQYENRLYEDWFLGSSGKKVGRFFTPRGVDDLDLIVPKFSTDLFVSIPPKNETRKGTFEETMLEFSQIEKKGYYSYNPYDVYGFNVREKIIYNDQAVNDDTILMICDSYALSVYPFLALNTKELHIVDVRDYEWYEGEKINLQEYIPQIHPDYVILFYKGVRSMDGSYNFF